MLVVVNTGWPVVVSSLLLSEVVPTIQQDIMGPEAWRWIEQTWGKRESFQGLAAGPGDQQGRPSAVGALGQAVFPMGTVGGGKRNALSETPARSSTGVCRACLGLCPANSDLLCGSPGNLTISLLPTLLTRSM